MKSLSGEELERLMESYTLLTHQFESNGGYTYRSELVGVLKGLGFLEEEFSKSVSTLSGGQKTRVALGKLLLQKPNLIILDEPTNHLDMSSIAWLETYLLNYKGAVMIVSHDRYFLDRISNKIIEIDQTKAESREKMLDKIERLEKPSEARTDMHISLEPKYVSGNDVLFIENLSKSFGPLHLFHDIGFELKRGEHVAVIGDNGTGKTTILKIINGLLDPDCGSIRTGTNVHIGYYDQEHHVLHTEKTLFEEISDDYPALTNTEIRNTLAAFLFTGEDVFKRIGDISGGERGRVSLAKLMLSESNFLILDEPTNHLDIASKEILEDALNSYSGTVLYVSHDRYFINRTASRILELSGGSLTNYLGNYDYYLEKKQEKAAVSAGSAQSDAPNSSAASLSANSNAEKESSAKLNWLEQKEQQARQRKKANEIKRIEERIETLENRNAEIDSLMAKPDICTNVAKLQELSKEKNEVQNELDSLMERWEALESET